MERMKNSMSVLIYGLKEEKLIHIDDVKNGIECGCVCPNCGERLIAKQGKINEHHFAHEAKECDITIAQETTLHIMAKEILVKSKHIMLPQVILEDRFAFYTRNEYLMLESNKNDLYYQYRKYKNMFKKIDNVTVEKYLDNIKPDIVLEIEGKKLLIEIAVTHFIDDKKKTKIINMNIPTIQIDLSSFRNTINEISRDELTKILLKETDHKKWIYYKNMIKDIEEVKSKNQMIIEKQKEVYDYWIKNFNNEYRRAYEYCCEDSKNKFINDFWKKQWLSKITPIPWFADYPINGDILYSGDRRIWQGIIINKIFYSQSGIPEEDVVKYITDQKFLKVSGYNPYGLTFQERQSKLLNKTNRYQVIRDYYKFLQAQNIIDSNGKWIYEF